MVSMYVQNRFWAVSVTPRLTLQHAPTAILYIKYIIYTIHSSQYIFFYLINTSLCSYNLIRDCSITAYKLYNLQKTKIPINSCVIQLIDYIVLCQVIQLLK